MIPKVKFYGNILKTHGVNGELRLEINPNLVELDIELDKLFVDIDGGLVPFDIISARFISHNELLICLDTINSEEEAVKLLGATLFIDESLIDDAVSLDEELWSLVDYEVIDNKHGYIGKVVAVIDTNENILLEIEFENKEILIPFHEDIIVEIDEDSRQMCVKAPDGLIELYLE